MDAKITWAENMAFSASTQSGHNIIMDAAPDIGGNNLGPRPMELMLIGAGGCISIDMMLILKKTKQNITSYELTLQAQRAAQDPKVFTHINFHFDIYGTNIDTKTVERAIALSHEKYCSASIMLEKTAQLSFSFTVHPA